MASWEALETRSSERELFFKSPAPGDESLLPTGPGADGVGLGSGEHWLLPVLGGATSVAGELRGR